MKTKGEGSGYEFEEAWIDINGFTKKDWDKIRELCSRMIESGTFKGDPLKCAVGAFVYLVAEGYWLQSDEISSEDEFIH